jgi:hypothetical protein
MQIESGARGEEKEEREMMMSEMRMREPVAALLRNQPPILTFSRRLELISFLHFSFRLTLTA